MDCIHTTGINQCPTPLEVVQYVTSIRNVPGATYTVKDSLNKKKVVLVLIQVPCHEDVLEIAGTVQRIHSLGIR